MKRYAYTGETAGAVPNVGFVEPGAVIEAMSEQHEEAIKASGHFKLERAVHKEESAEPKTEPKAEPKKADDGKGGKK